MTMTNELIIALLALLSIGSLAAVFILWAKMDELKRIAKDERDNYFAALSLHNTTAELADKQGAEITELYSCIDSEIDAANKARFEWSLAEDRCDALQDRLSALLCPKNDHIWIDGVCKRCGRRQDIG